MSHVNQKVLWGQGPCLHFPQLYPLLRTQYAFN